MKVHLYDTTLRDGAQQEGISFSVEDKLKIARKLDELGIQYIEGGWPGSNPKDIQFFERARDLNLAGSTICAFGSTRRAKSVTENDTNLKALLEAGTRIVTIVGKSSGQQVTRVLETDLEENLAMIRDSVAFLKQKGVRVFFDAEHFFDGFKADSAYALETLKVAAEAGAECLILCDTNGGALPYEVGSIIESVKASVSTPLGIHAHNDSDTAVACSLVAARAGVEQVQGTINGYGERCGNANLCSIIPALRLKLGVECVSSEQLSKLTEVSHYVSELANLVPSPRKPYVGSSAFAHKGGLHVSAMSKWAESYQHIDPALVGNRSAVLISELSGVSNIVYKAKERGLTLSRQEEARRILEQVKLMESRGFQYEDAEASFDLLIHRAKSEYKAPFDLVDFMVMVERRRRPATNGEETMSEATVKVKVDNEVMHTASVGNGPVDALDKALRKALKEFYPSIEQVRLIDYKVRILDESAGTEAQVRVLISSSDGEEEWTTVGSSANIIEASWLALADSLEYWLLKSGRHPAN